MVLLAELTNKNNKQPVKSRGKSTPKRTQRSGRNNNRKQQTSSHSRMVGIPAAYAGGGATYNGNMKTRQSGTDLLSNLSIPSNKAYATGEVILAAALTAGSSKRMQYLTDTFLRIKWHTLRFNVEGAFPTTTGGGYIAVFIRDPSDLPPDDPMEMLQWAMAHQTAVDCKWYDTGIVRVPETPDLLFTAISGEPRLYSPGKLYIIAKGGPAQTGTLTVSLNWDVTLSEPAVEAANNPEELFELPYDLYVPYKYGTGDYVVIARLANDSVNPETRAFLPVDLNDLGLSSYPDGTIVTFATPMSITGKWSGAQPFSAVSTAEFAIGTVRGPYGVNGASPASVRCLRAVNVNSDGSLTNYMIGSGTENWNAFVGPAGGAFATRGSKFTVVPPNTKLVPQFMDVFSPRGLVQLYTGKHIRVAITPPDVEEQIAQMRVTGEALTQW